MQHTTTLSRGSCARIFPRRSKVMWPTGPVRHALRTTCAAPATTAASNHLVLAPAPSNTAPPETEVLLVLAPGFGIEPQDMKTLAESAQAAAPDVRMWAVCMDLNYQGLIAKVMQEHPSATFAEAASLLGSSGVLDALLAEVKDAAAAAGFKPRTTGWGRVTNLYLLAQSAAGVTLAPTAFKSVAGLILLASTFDGRYSRGVLPSLEDWGRPVLLLGGELDGQMRWPWLAPLAADAAVLAQKAGPCYAAAAQPVILVPDANHAQTTNNVMVPGRGDIPARVAYASAVGSFGAAIGAFLSAHESASQGSRRAAADELLGMVRRTAELLGPYFMASGMGDLCAAWITGRQGGPESTASLDMPHTSQQHPAQHQQHRAAPGHASSTLQQPLLQGVRRDAGSRFSAGFHPGVVQKAERFVAAAQLRLCSSLPREVLGRLRIVVQTHTEVETLLLNQPRISEQPDGSLVLAVHALLALPNLVRPGNPLPSCSAAAPEYWLKLKRPQAIADAIGLPGSFPDGVTAAALNQGALDAALAAAPPAAAARYRASGWQVAVGPDATSPDINAEKFVKESAPRFEAVPAGDAAAGDGAAGDAGSSSKQRGPLGTVTLTSPVLTSQSVSEAKQAAAAGAGGQAAAAAAAADDPYMARFLGNWYTKVWSVAQAMEWVMLDSLRETVAW